MASSTELLTHSNILDAVDHTDAPPPLRRKKSSLRLLTELSRERISLRYLHAWNELYRPQFIDRNAFPANNLPMPTPAACDDTGLAAFAQLAALRVGVRRAFVTLMTRDVEHVLVESTRSMSLQSDFTADEKDKSWLGTSCFARADGINDKALDGWRRARTYREMPEDSEHYYTEGLSHHWCIVSDVGNNLEYSQRPFVARARSPRFFFSIPLRDSDGAVIGSLSMLDDKPRFGVSSDDMLFCEDLGDTIAQHLHQSMVSAQRQRSERLIKALGTFNDGGRSLKDWWIGENDTSMQRGGRRRDHARTYESKSLNFDQEFGAEDEHFDSSRSGSPTSTAQTLPKHPRSASDGNTQASEDRNKYNVSGRDFDHSFAQPLSEESQELVQKLRNVPEVRVLSQPRQETGLRATHGPFDAAAQLKNAYGRASNLLREATGAFGVVFLDASAASAARPLDAPSTLQATKRFRSDGSDSQGTTASSVLTSSDASSKLLANSDTDLSDSQQRSKLCRVVGRSTQTPSPEDSMGSSSTLQISERELARLIKSYPLGNIFNYTTSGTPYSGSEESAGSGEASSESAVDVNAKRPRANNKYARHARLLGRFVGDARSIAFYPVWDDTNNHYRSCLFAWTHRSDRFFDGKEDMTYLSAFSHSLRAEISRIETIASDVAKGKFISSVSHELRSPLHGILAGVELLQGSKLTPFQEEMALSVALAGRTLLDTVEHILDFSKVSNLTREQKRDRATAQASRHDSAELESDKSLLTVVDLAAMTEEVVESVVSAHRFSRSLEADPRGQEREPVSVVLDIDKRHSWVTAMTPGSWTRVLTNVVGNALKYTPSGMVTVKLIADEGENASGHTSSVTNVILQIQDTGIGMTKDFISNDISVPFRQADHHSAGTGLGLSIVKEIVKEEFRGSLGVESELGKGSCVSVRFVAKFTQRVDATNDDVDHISSPKDRHLHMIHLADFLEYAPSLGTMSVADSLLRTASQWLGCDISSSRDMSSGPSGSICVVSETELAMLNKKRYGALKALVNTLAESGSRLLIFGRSVASCSPEFDFSGFKLKPLYIHQPVAPQKLSRVVRYTKDSTIIRHKNDLSSLAHIAQKQSPTTIRGDVSRITPMGRDQRSYFDMPSNDSKARSPNSLITPGSLMQATTAESPPSVPPTLGRQVSESREQPATNADRPRGDVILLVEDNHINMRLLVTLMKRQSLRYESATNGLEAFNKYKEDPSKWRLILSDLNMPVMDGFESTAKIREYERKNSLKSIKICALTGVTDEEARSKAFNAGVDRYLTKPIKMRDVTKLMDEMRRSDLTK